MSHDELLCIPYLCRLNLLHVHWIVSKLVQRLAKRLDQWARHAHDMLTLRVDRCNLYLDLTMAILSIVVRHEDCLALRGRVRGISGGTLIDLT